MYTLQYSYDVGSRVTVALDPLSRYSCVYNKNDQVTRVTSGVIGRLKTGHSGAPQNQPRNYCERGW